MAANLNSIRTTGSSSRSLSPSPARNEDHPANQTSPRTSPAHLARAASRSPGRRTGQAARARDRPSCSPSARSTNTRTLAPSQTAIPAPAVLAPRPVYNLPTDFASPPGSSTTTTTPRALTPSLLRTATSPARSSTPRLHPASAQSSPRTPTFRLPSHPQPPPLLSSPSRSRAKPTLAMSIQVPRARSPTYSQPGSPKVFPADAVSRGRAGSDAPRKPGTRGRSESRSERLLRDTLRKAEEVERARALAQLPPLPAGYNKGKAVEKMWCEDGCEDDWAVFAQQQQQQQQQPPQVRRPEMIRGVSERNHSRKASASSFSEMSGHTSPHMVRSPTSPVLTGRDMSMREAARDARDGTPHGAVLRSRLEGVLRGAGRGREWDEAQSPVSSRIGLPTPAHSPGSPPTPPETWSSSSSRKGKEVLRGGGGGEEVDEAMLTPPPTPPPARSYAAQTQKSPSPKSRPSDYFHAAAASSSITTSSPLPLHHHHHLQSHSYPNSNPPPPQSPSRPSAHFDARSAARQCREMTGLVSFRNVEGLGCPVEEESEGTERRGWGWGRVFG